jgi:hypothetical protein
VSAEKACRALRAASLGGYGENNLFRVLLKERHFTRIVGVDVSLRVLERAAEKLRLERLPDRERQRIELLHSPPGYFAEKAILLPRTTAESAPTAENQVLFKRHGRDVHEPECACTGDLKRMFRRSTNAVIELEAFNNEV